MVRTSTIRKSEVGSFLRLCRELTLGTPSFSLSLCLSFSFFPPSQSAANFLGVKEGETWQGFYKSWPKAHQQAFMFSHSGINPQFHSLFNSQKKSTALWSQSHSNRFIIITQVCSSEYPLNYSDRKHQPLIKCYKPKSSCITLSPNINNPLISLEANR